MKRYYYVYNPNQKLPTVAHPESLSAVIEAERLAMKHPGQQFEILECIAIARVNKAITFWLDED